MKTKALLAACLMLVGTALPALANQTNDSAWTFAAAPMGQYEGGLYINNSSHIGYGCAGFYSHFGFTIPGNRLGFAAIYIDGKHFKDITLTASHDGKDTIYSLDVKNESSAAAKQNLNSMLDAVAAGNRIEIRSRDGATTYESYSLKGASKGRVCKM